MIIINTGMHLELSTSKNTKFTSVTSLNDNLYINSDVGREPSYLIVSKPH